MNLLLAQKKDRLRLLILQNTSKKFANRLAKFAKLLKNHQFLCVSHLTSDILGCVSTFLQSDQYGCFR